MRNHPRNRKSPKRPLSVVYRKYAAVGSCAERVTLTHWDQPIRTEQDIGKLLEAVLKENDHLRNYLILILSWQRFDQ